MVALSPTPSLMGVHGHLNQVQWNSNDGEENTTTYNINNSLSKKIKAKAIRNPSDLTTNQKTYTRDLINNANKYTKIS